MPTVRFVLVRTRSALNLGSAARAMMNFGLTDLAVVSPREAQWRETRAAGGALLLGRAKLVSLDEAIAGCALVLGTDSSPARARGRAQVTLPALRGWLKRRLPKGGRVAFLFGSEKDGLRNEELSRCHALLRIPTQARSASMNLGQAVALTAYELSRPGLERIAALPREPTLDARLMEGLVETTMRAMEKAKVNAYLPAAARRQKVRKGYLRWQMSFEDASWLLGLLGRLQKPPGG